MGKEIERKFLVNKEQWKKVDKPLGDIYRQGYLLTDPNKTIRIRVTKKNSFLTIKGISVGATRLEYEYQIPIQEGIELLDNFGVSELSKIRYKIDFDNKVWEIDEFLGDNKGLFIAEIELTTEDEKFTFPLWIGEEVTGQEKYYNSNLTIEPFNKW